MILVDSSVWIHYFKGNDNPQTEWLDRALGTVFIVTGDLILMEVLQGFHVDKEFLLAKNQLIQFPVINMGGQEMSIKSAIHYRKLRKQGITVRKSIDVLIGTFCIHHHLTLLHDDRDFEPMVKYLHLKTVEFNIQKTKKETLH